ncbi:MAG: OmpA family protein [Pararhodobacter sp.]
MPKAVVCQRFPSTVPLALTVLFSLMLALVAAPVQAQRAIEGASPHPAVPLPPGGYITRDEFVDFATIEFPTGPHARNQEQPVISVEGAHLRQEYTIDGTEIAALRLYRTYLQHLEGQGYEIVFAGIGQELSERRSVDFLARNIFAAQPSSSSEAGYILGRNADESQYVAVSFFVRQGNNRIMVNVVDVEELETLDLLAPEPQPEPQSEAQPEPEAQSPQTTEAVQQTAEELESGLVADGRVVVDAILFAFDSDEVLPESARALETVAGLMQENTGLSLLVVGHTDAVGSFDYNLRLSLSRASAVVDWLATRHGIARDRLRPAGAGPMSPITTNRTEAGRSLNRRVELVEVVE